MLLLYTGSLTTVLSPSLLEGASEATSSVTLAPGLIALVSRSMEAFGNDLVIGIIIHVQRRRRKAHRATPSAPAVAAAKNEGTKEA